MYTPVTWRKSSYSVENGNCVELSRTLDLVRDSKNPAGPVLSVDLSALLGELKAARLTT